MKTKRVNTSDIKLNPQNPRSISDSGLDKLIKSLHQFPEMMELREIVVDEDLVVLGGNMRLKALLKMGEKTARVKIAEGLTEEQKKEFIIKDNALFGEWDFDRLKIEWGELPLSEWGVDLPDDWLAPDEVVDAEPQIDKAAELNKVWQVQTGDLWQIGSHRLLCGDSKEIKNIEILFNKERANLSFTSPPYWVGKSYEKQKSINAINEFIKNSCAAIVYATKKHESRIVINTSTGFTTSFDKKNRRQTIILIDKWTNYFFELGWNLRHIRFWLKNGQLSSVSPKTDMIDCHSEFLGTFENNKEEETLIFNDDFQNEVEMIGTFYNRERGRERGQERLGGNAKKWALSSYWADIPGNANQNKHCASFPLLLPLRHLVMYSQKNEIVFDPFCGAGTTIVASHNLKRMGRGIEISPDYCAVILQRMSDAFPGIEIYKINP